jgi:competence protein ComEA
MNGSGRGQIAAYVVAAILLAVGGFFLLREEGGTASRAAGVSLDGAGGGAAPGGGPAPGGSVTPAGADSAAHGSRELFIHVAGAVRRPGIYRVPGGSRVAAAVRKAGGLTDRADLTAFNLAAGLRDAQQVIVPKEGEAPPGLASGVAATGASAGAAGPAGANGAAGAPGQPIPLSTATPEQLDGIDGIGPKLSAAIISYRDQHKGFKSIEELREVDGIGEKRFETLRRAVRP